MNLAIDNKVSPKVTRIDSKVAEQYGDLVKRIALSVKKRVPSWVELDDLIGAGNLGLVKALRNASVSSANLDVYVGMKIKYAIIDELRMQDMLTKTERRRVKRSDDIHFVDVEFAELIPIEEVESYEDLHEAIKLLSPRMKAVIEGYYFGNESQIRLAKVLNVCQSRVSQIRIEAVRLLKVLMYHENSYCGYEGKQLDVA